MMELEQLVNSEKLEEFSNDFDAFVKIYHLGLSHKPFEELYKEIFQNTGIDNKRILKKLKRLIEEGSTLKNTIENYKKSLNLGNPISDEMLESRNYLILKYAQAKENFANNIRKISEKDNKKY
jgi:hypothetical protein